MNAALDSLDAIEAFTTVEIEELRERRASLAASALAGDVQAIGALEATSLDLAAREEKLDLINLARLDHERREVLARTQGYDDERARLEDEKASLEEKLAAAVDQMQRAGIEAGEKAARACDLGSQLATVKSSLGLHHGRPCGPLFGELLQVRLRDQCAELVFDRRVSAAERLGLLECFPLVDGADAAKPGKTCTVCSHEKTSEIEQALAAGRSLREIETEYGVSRSALSRHRGHD